MLRLGGVLFGTALCLLGLLLLLGPDVGLTAPIRERATGFGSTLLVVGAIALLASLTMRRVDLLWYRKPERWQMMHGRRTSWRQWWRP